MVRTLQVVCLLLVAVAMAQALAHTLEMPGKMRLSQETYRAVQEIYYPGFTFGGIAEPAGIVALLVLLFVAPLPGTRFWWAIAALVALAGMHLVFWFVTQPANSVWTKDLRLTGISATFFSLFAPDLGGDWTRLRDVWEYSHVARAVLGVASLICITLAIIV